MQRILTITLLLFSRRFVFAVIVGALFVSLAQRSEAEAAEQATAWVHLSTGTGFELKSSFQRFAGFWDAQRWLVGDFNGDGKDDLLNVYGRKNPDGKLEARAWVHRSTGNGFERQTSLQTLAGFWDAQRWLVGDFNGDGKDDLLNVYGRKNPDGKLEARAWVHRSTGNGFERQTSLQTLAGFWDAQRWLVGDFNGESKDDLVNVYGKGDFENQPIACKESTIDLFENDDPLEVLEVTLRADFDSINGEQNRDDATSPGTLTYIDPISGLPVSVGSTVEARGHSRFDYCEWRPLRLRFDSNPAGTLLDGTGKTIKIVTHCEWKSSPVLDMAGILRGTPVEDRRRLLQEFTLYEVLAAMGSTALETRLALITYEDPSGTPLKTEYAFFREREKRAAERCGFERLELDEGDPDLPSNPTSLFQVQFHHQFVFSHDYEPKDEHNVIRMGSPNGMEYYMPYDFDLSGIIHPSYFQNDNLSIEENGQQLISWLNSWPDQDLVRVQVFALLEHEEEMRQRIVESLVDAEGKARLQEWFEDHIQRLKDFLE